MNAVELSIVCTYVYTCILLLYSVITSDTWDDVVCRTPVGMDKGVDTRIPGGHSIRYKLGKPRRFRGAGELRQVI